MTRKRGAICRLRRCSADWPLPTPAWESYTDLPRRWAEGFPRRTERFARPSCPMGWKSTCAPCVLAHPKVMRCAVTRKWRACSRGGADATAEDGITWTREICRELEIPPLKAYGIGEHRCSGAHRGSGQGEQYERQSAGAHARGAGRGNGIVDCRLTIFVSRYKAFLPEAAEKPRSSPCPL